MRGQQHTSVSAQAKGKAGQTERPRGRDNGAAADFGGFGLKQKQAGIEGKEGEEEKRILSF
jgi:hypothetical protein